MPAGRPRKPIERARATMRNSTTMANGRRIMQMPEPSAKEMAERREALDYFRQRDEQRFFERHGITWDEYVSEGISDL